MTLLVRSQGVNICLIAVIGNWDQRPIISESAFTLPNY